MDKNKLWLIGSALVMAAVIVMGSLLGIQPQLAAMSTANEARSGVEASNAGQAAVLAQLKSDFAGIDKLKADLAPLDASVPSGTEMSPFVTQLGTLADETKVTLSGITVADALPYAPVVAPVAAAAPAASGSTPTPTAAPSDAAAPLDPTAGVPPVTNSKITANNFASLAVQITVTGTYANALDFVNGLQTGQRLFLVSGLSTAPLEGEDSTRIVTATISGLVYALVPTAPEATAASN